MRILFVCLGNICRSPLAEALFVHKINARGLAEKFEADSCGTSNYNIGDGPDHRTVKNATRNGVPMNHVARQLTRADINQYDRILVMDQQNLKNVLAVSDPEHHSKIMMMRSFDPEGEEKEVPDPYYGGEQDFQEVFEILDRSVQGLIEALVNENGR